jgi:hypothetical protein
MPGRGRPRISTMCGFGLTPASGRRLDNARAAWACPPRCRTLADEQPVSVYRDSRDMTGLIDGTANPEPSMRQVWH